MPELDPQHLAELVRDKLFAADRAAQSLGIAITAIGVGTATMTMSVRDDMLNGFNICHGGYITALADTAFAYACNSGNELTVASGLSVDFVAPAAPGEVLIARAHEVSASGRTGVYDVQVRTAAGAIVAAFRGRSYRIKGRPSVAV